MRAGILLSAMAVLILASVSGPSQTTNRRPSTIRPLDGASIFRNYCASCHGVDGRGNGPASRALKQDASDLTRLAQRNGGSFPTVHVRTTIMFGADEVLSAHGSKDMPIWGPVFHQIEFDRDLGNVRLENVTRYLESIQRK